MSKQTAPPSAEEADKYISAAEALEIIRKKVSETISLATLLRWVDTHKLGYQPGGPGRRYYIYKDKFTEFANGPHHNAGQ